MSLAGKREGFELLEVKLVTVRNVVSSDELHQVEIILSRWFRDLRKCCFNVVHFRLILGRSRNACIKIVQRHQVRFLFLFSGHHFLLSLCVYVKKPRPPLVSCDKKYAARIAVPNVSPYSLRHSFATHMLGRGVDLRQMYCKRGQMGHFIVSLCPLRISLHPLRLRF